MSRLILDFRIITRNDDSRFFRLDNRDNSILKEKNNFFANFDNKKKYNIFHEEIYNFYKNENEILLINAKEFSNIRDLKNFIKNTDYKHLVILNFYSEVINNLEIKEALSILLEDKNKTFQFFGYTNELLKKENIHNVIHLCEEFNEGSAYYKKIKKEKNIEHKEVIKFKRLLEKDVLFQNEFYEYFEKDKSNIEIIKKFIKNKYKEENYIYMISLISFLLYFNKKTEITEMFEDNIDFRFNYLSFEYIKYASKVLFNKKLSNQDLKECIKYFKFLFKKTNKDNYKIKSYEIEFIFFEVFYEKYKKKLRLENFINYSENDIYYNDLNYYLKNKTCIRHEYDNLKDKIWSLELNEIKKEIKNAINRRKIPLTATFLDVIVFERDLNDLENYFEGIKIIAVENNRFYYLTYFEEETQKEIEKLLEGDKKFYKRLKKEFPINKSKNEKIKLLELIDENINFEYINNKEEFFKITILQLEKLKKELENDVTFIESITDKDTESKSDLRIPKDENHIRNLLLEKLKVKLNGIIINKEVEVKNNNRIDINIEKTSNSEMILKIPIEAKRFNNQDLYKSIEEQLYNKYLKPENLKEGVYLTFSFDKNIINCNKNTKRKIRGKSTLDMLFDIKRNDRIEGKIKKINKKEKVNIKHVNFHFKK